MTLTDIFILIFFLQNVKKTIAHVCPRPLSKIIVIPPRSWITFLLSYDNIVFLLVLLLSVNALVLCFNFFRHKVGRRQQYLLIPGTGTTELTNVVSAPR